jgi:anti-sigma B factor antagonist
MADPAGRLKMMQQGPVSIVELVDKKILDEARIADIGERLYALVAESAQPRIVLDFVNVGHMSSSALGMLITLHKRVRDKEGVLRLCNIRPSIHEVFEITRLTEVFGIRATREEAIREAASS